MRRRSFLQLLGLGTAAVVVPTVGVSSASVENALAGIILNEFHFLKIERKGVEQFVADYYRMTGANKQFFMNVKTKAYYFLKVDSERSQLVRTLTQLYLMSTDFFQNRMDESKEVKYLGWYNPHKTPCANPFSSIYYPQTA
jgi:hypothetical protein